MQCRLVGRAMARSICELLEERAAESFSLHEQFLNTQRVRVVEAIGSDRRAPDQGGPLT